MGRKRKNNIEPKVHSELAGLDLRINEFGEIISNIDIEKVNAFLTKNVPDKKLINRNDDQYQQEFKIEEHDEPELNFEDIIKPVPEADDL